MLRILTCLLILLFINSHAAPAIDKPALDPGQIIVEFTSAASLNLYAYKARRIDVLSELSKYIKIDLFTNGWLDNPITVEIREQSLDRVLNRLVGEQNFILRYENKLVEGEKQLNARFYQTPPGSSLKDSARQYGVDKADIKLNAVNDQRMIIEKLEDIGDFENPEAIRQDVRILNLDNATQRLTLAESLGDIGTDNAVRLLKDLVKDESPEVRETAIYSLGDIGSTASTRILGLAANDANPALRDLAISELALINSDQSVESLTRLFSWQDIDLQVRLLQTIAEINTPAAKIFLWDMLESENSKISITAYELLTQTRGLREIR